MKDRMKKIAWGLAAAMVLVGLLWVWIRCQVDGGEPVADVFFAAEEPETEPMEIAVKTVHGNEALFTATAEDFLQHFNSVFARDFASSYFPPLMKWKSRDYTAGIHSQYPTMQFYFSEDEKVYSLPTVTLYTPLEERCIQEITINFDEHSYTESGYERYKQLCIYTLKVFFPTLSEEAVSQLCDQVIALGNQHVFSSDAWYGSGDAPWALFYRDGVGIYPYFAIGDWQRFCVIPVTDEILNEWEQKGVILYEIE